MPVARDVRAPLAPLSDEAARELCSELERLVETPDGRPADRSADGLVRLVCLVWLDWLVSLGGLGQDQPDVLRAVYSRRPCIIARAAADISSRSAASLAAHVKAGALDACGPWVRRCARAAPAEASGEDRRDPVR